MLFPFDMDLEIQVMQYMQLHDQKMKQTTLE